MLMDEKTYSMTSKLLEEEFVMEQKEKSVLNFELDIKKIRFLIENGCQLNNRNKFGNSPFHVALMNRNTSLDVLKFLVEMKADLELSGQFGNRALHMVLKNDNVSLELVRYLVEIKVDVNSVNEMNQDSPLHVLSRQDTLDLEILKYLVESKADCNQRNKYSNLPLHIYCDRSNKIDHKVLRFLLENHRDVNARNETNYDTALHLTCWNTFIEIETLKIFNEFNASFNIQNKYGESPIHVISANDLVSVEMLKFLIDHCQADIYLKNNRMDNVLHLVVCNRYLNLDVIKFLIEEKRFNFDQPNYIGNTPLHNLLKSSCLTQNFKSILIMLLCLGADLNIKNGQHETCFDILYETNKGLEDLNKFDLESFLLDYKNGSLWNIRENHHFPKVVQSNIFVFLLSIKARTKKLFRIPKYLLHNCVQHYVASIIESNYK